MKSSLVAETVLAAAGTVNRTRSQDILFVVIKTSDATIISVTIVPGTDS